MAARMPENDYESLKEYVSSLSPDDQSESAQTKRAQVSSFKDWAAANELRHRLRWQWHDFFEDYDVVLTPTTPTPAFEHDHRDFGERTLMVDNEERDYFEGVFWSGLSGIAYLPSTIVPTGLGAEGLPIGVQIIGPEYSDLITIGIAGELEQMGFQFVPPKNYL
jgi:amidase